MQVVNSIWALPCFQRCSIYRTYDWSESLMYLFDARISSAFLGNSRLISPNAEHVSSPLSAIYVLLFGSPYFAPVLFRLENIQDNTLRPGRRDSIGPFTHVAVLLAHISAVYCQKCWNVRLLGAIAEPIRFRDRMKINCYQVRGRQSFFNKKLLLYVMQLLLC